MGAIIITGATSGIGLETARILAAQGFHILGIGRNKEKCNKARADILSEYPGARIDYFVADLMQQRQVLRVAHELVSLLDNIYDGALYALINNVGCVRGRYMTTEEGYEQQFALNHLAGFLLTYELLPSLLRAKGRVIMTGSESHKRIKIHWDDVMLRRGYNPLTAYKQSKLCNLLFARGLNDRYGSMGVRAYVVDPGLVNTDIGNKNTGGLVNFIWMLRKRRGVCPSIPVKTYEFLCRQESTQDGLYYYQSSKAAYSRHVTRENANKLFGLSERLCGVSYEKGKEK